MDRTEASSSAWLTVARGGWVLIAGIATVILLASIPTYLHALGTDISANFPLPAGWSRETLLLFDAFGRATSFLSSLLSIGLAVLLYVRRRRDPMALLVSFFLLIYGVTFTGPAERLELELTGRTDIALSASALLMTTPSVLIFSLFPNGRFVPAWTRWLSLLSPVWIAAYLAFPVTNLSAIPSGVPQTILVVAIAFIVVPLLYAQIYRYRRVSTPTERQQTKWVIYGFGLWMVLVVLSSFPYLTILSLPPGTPPPPSTYALALLWWITQTIVPVSLGVALLRYRLWEIDLIINRTLVYGSLTGVLMAIYLAAVVSFQQIFHEVTGQETPFAIVLSTLIIAALFNPLRQRIQAFINRRFYRSRYDARRALAELSRKMRDKVDLAEMSQSLLKMVDGTLQPRHLSLWLKDKG